MNQFLALLIGVVLGYLLRVYNEKEDKKEVEEKKVENKKSKYTSFINRKRRYKENAR